MRIVLAAAFVAATATLALADDQPAATDMAALHNTSAQQGVPVQTPADNTTLEPSFYGFSDGCEKAPRKSDTAKLLMN